VSRTEAELRAQLAHAGQLPHGVGQTSALEDVVRHADAGSHRQLAFAARRKLANAYCVDRQWDKAFPLFARCLSEYDQKPDGYGPEEDWALRQWYAYIVTTMAEFPEITLAQINGALDDVEGRFKAGGHSLREVHAARRFVAQQAGDWDEEERCYRLWQASGGPQPGNVWDFEAEIERLVLRGDPASAERALALAAPVLAGQRTFTEPSFPILCLMLLPLARAGELAQAAELYHRARLQMKDGVHRYEYSAMLHEFCALTGQAHQGLADLQVRLRGWYTLNRPSGKLRYATAVAVLCRELVAVGLGGHTVKASSPQDVINLATLGEQSQGVALDLAARFDERNGNAWQGNQTRTWLTAPPVTTALRLKPTAAPPARLAPVPPGLPVLQLIERAEWHTAREESGAAWQYLVALGDPAQAGPAAGPAAGAVAGRAAELRARLTWGRRPEVEARLRFAADAHLKAGDRLRHLTCLCWLGAWHGEYGNTAQGTAILTQALAPLRETGGHRSLAVAKRLCALDLRRREGRAAAWPALLVALQHAQAAGDPLITARVALTAAGWRNADAPRPNTDYALMAKEAFSAAQAPAGVVRALELARLGSRKAGTTGTFLTLINAELARLPPQPPAQLLGYLRLRRGFGLVAAGRSADALDDLAFGVAEAHTRYAESPQDVFHLAVALHDAGRKREAAEELSGVTSWLDNLSGSGTAGRPDLADRAHALVAQWRRELGDTELALAEFEHLAASARRAAQPAELASAVHQAAQLLDQLGRHADAAQHYRVAGDAAAQCGHAYLAAVCRSAEALALSRAGYGEAALTALEVSRRAAQAVPGRPAPMRTTAWAWHHQAAALVLSAARRTEAAAEEAGQAAAAFRQIGEPLRAAEMDQLTAGRSLSSPGS
jgi:hypothetical protein